MENETSEEEKYICLKCGTALTKEQEFCSKCGTKRGEKNNKKCKKCGNIIDVGEKYCSKCGEKVKFDIEKDITDKTKRIKVSKKKIIVSIILIIIVLMLIVIGKKILPQLLITKDELLQEGNYFEAYKKALDNEKKEISTENLLAYICKDIKDGLKDPSSFVLTSAYMTNDEIVICINANNSYGASVKNYYYYKYNDQDSKYKRKSYLSSLEYEKSYSWDDYSEKLEKNTDNLNRILVTGIMSNEKNKVDKKIIDNINLVFKNDKLDSVELLDVNKGNNTQENDT